MYRSNFRGWLKHFDFILTDILWLIAALVLSFFLRNGSLSLFRDEFYMTLLFLYPVVHVLLAIFFNSYSNILRRGYWQEFKYTLLHNTLTFLLIVVFLFLSKSSDIYSRIVVCLSAVFAFVFMYISHLFMKKVVTRLRIRRGNATVRMLVMARTSDIEATVRTLIDNNRNAGICGLVVYDTDMIGKAVCGIPVVASADTWKEYLLSNVVDEVLIDLEDTREAGSCIEYINSVGATAHMVLRFSEVTSPVKTVQRLNGFTVVSSSLNTATPRQRFVKRCIDIVFGLIGAVAVIILTVFIGPLIWLEDRGPIFFTQKRVGRNGRVFRIIKYRTMYTDAEARKAELEKDNEMSGLMFKMKDDPRITKIGKFLRKTSIDELPQAFNILAGQMSVVGTRPPTLNEYTRYEPHHKVRLSITPGLTGLWQVSGRSEITDFEKIVALDEQYIREWNLALDFKIILRTFAVVLKGEGAE